MQDLVEKYDVKLTKTYTIDSDPLEMEEEYKMHKEKRNKNNQVKFYKQVLLNIVCGAEFVNDKYNPFEFKLKDWSKQIAADMDDYTEVLEEIYEKYKDRGGKMAPEIRLLFMIIMSGVTFHLSQSLFGSGGLDATMQKNPNLINKLLGGFMKGKMGMDAEPREARELPSNNKDLLDTMRRYNQNKKTETKTETAVSESSTASQQRSVKKIMSDDKIKKKLEDQRQTYENQLRKKDDIIMTQMEQIKNYNDRPQTSVVHSEREREHDREKVDTKSPINQVLSDASGKPRFRDNPILSATRADEDSPTRPNMFDSEIRDSDKQTQQYLPTKQSVAKNQNHWNELMESLEESTDRDLDEIIESSNKQRTQNPKSISKPIVSSKKPPTSIRKPINSTSKRRTESGSDGSGKRGPPIVL